MPSIQRDNLLSAYLENQKIYLKAHFPDRSEEELDSFIRNVINQHIQRPTAEVIVHPSVGNTILKEVDTLQYIKDTNDKIITPSGTIYHSTDEVQAFDKQFIDDLRNKRDKSKKLMLQYAGEGKELEKQLEDYNQSLCKILVNSIIGSNGNNQNAMYDLEAFNGVTSMARHGVIMAYAYVERFLTSNFYFPTLEHVLNFITTAIRRCPPKEQVLEVISKYKLIQPLPNEVATNLRDSLKLYTYNTSSAYRKINSYLESIPQYQCTFIYYTRNLWNLFTTNDILFKSYLRDLYSQHENISEDDYKDIDPTTLYKIDGDLLQIVATFYQTELNGIQIKKAPKDNPILAKKLTYISNKIQYKLIEYKPLFDLLLHNDCLISYIHAQKNIIRKCVAVSDTDSVLFTPKHLITWYLGGKLDYSQDAFNVNAIIVYLLTKSIASIIRHMSIARGAVGDNIGMIEMKNEYLYPVFIKTGIGKHYAGDITVQEGNFLPSPNLDIKGVSFMSSNLPKISHDFLKSIIKDIQSDIKAHGNIYISDYINRALDYESDIYKSLKKGEFTYFPNTGIRNKEEYKKPEASVYRNYEFWEKVFSDKYGSIVPPSKVPIIPIQWKLLQSNQYQEWLRNYDIKVYTNLVNYISKNPKDINRVPLSLSTVIVPPELVPLLKIRPIIYKNLSPVQLAYKSIGIDLGDAKKMPLFLDYYSTNQI